MVINRPHDKVKQNYTGGRWGRQTAFNGKLPEIILKIHELASNRHGRTEVGGSRGASPSRLYGKKIYKTLDTMGNRIIL